MKRIEDGIHIHAKPSSKRPCVSSWGQSWRSLIGRGGGGGERARGARRLTPMDASTYLKEVKDVFIYQREKYATFLHIMRDFRAQRTDIAGVTSRVKELFKGHNALILGFNTFLSEGYEIALGDDEGKAPPEIGLQHAGKHYIKKVNALFRNQPDLLEEFARFLPDSASARLAENVPFIWEALHGYDEQRAMTTPLKALTDEESTSSKGPVSGKKKRRG